MNDDLDDLILSVVSDRWRKVARVIGMASEAFPDADANPRYEQIAERIRALADAGRIESVGNLSRWRYSEVRLPVSQPDGVAKD